MRILDEKFIIEELLLTTNGECQKEVVGLQEYLYDPNHINKNRELYCLTAIKIIVRDKNVNLNFPLSNIKYYLWKEREVRLWRQNYPMFKFPNDHFPNLQLFENNSHKAKHIWKLNKLFVKGKVLKLKRVNKL